MKTFEAKIIADSINPDLKRVTSFLLTYPRFIHSELMTHRIFSRNAASSRAIPVSKIIEQVKNNPAMPVRWGKNGRGMQDHGVFAESDNVKCKEAWLSAASSAVESAERMEAIGLHKQITNRVLEPFVWMTTMVTATEWENFFSLRLHKDAQPEFQHLAHIMLKAYLSSIPDEKDWGQWHIPFGSNMPDNISDDVRLKIATARAARTSYLTMDGKIDQEKDVSLHDMLAESGHWSPFEHPCFASKNSSGNFKGWSQYRSTFSGENRICDLEKLLYDYEDEDE